MPCHLKRHVVDALVDRQQLVDGRREAVQVRLGASDGSMTEVSGNLSEGDLIVTGERAAAR